jgi:hypothetical protein
MSSTIISLFVGSKHHALVAARRWICFGGAQRRSIAMESFSYSTPRVADSQEVRAKRQSS